MDEADRMAANDQVSSDVIRAGKSLAAVLLGLAEDADGHSMSEAIQEVKLAGMNRIFDRAKEINKARGIAAEIAVPLSIVRPLLDAASEESAEELVDVWAGLLAAARDPGRASLIRKDFIPAVQRMDPVDAIILALVPSSQHSANVRAELAWHLKVDERAVELSLFHLVEIGLVQNKTLDWADASRTAMAHFYPSPLGEMLLRALA